MNNLNKENFFNELTEKYPLAMKKFRDWIDAYKKDNDWDKLFNSNAQMSSYYGATATSSFKTKSPKFHDLPFDMQSGIIIRFACENFKDADNAYLGVNEMKELFSSCIEELNTPSEE